MMKKVKTKLKEKNMMMKIMMMKEMVTSRVIALVLKGSECTEENFQDLFTSQWSLVIQVSKYTCRVAKRHSKLCKSWKHNYWLIVVQ